MIDTPHIHFQCIGCDYSEEIELEAIQAITLAGKVGDAWFVPDPWDNDWHRNESGQLVCQTCRETYLQEGPERSETLSAEERNRGLMDEPSGKTKPVWWDR